MPIKIPAELPAHDVLRREGVMVMAADAALRQDIRPLRIALVNLMPNKVATETQFARLIGATPLQIELSLIRMTGHRSKTTSAQHLAAFYQTFAQARTHRFDGLIVTGAPIETLAFADIGYWDELTEVFAWSQTHVTHTVAVCWGAQAMLHHFHGVPKHTLAAKAFGAYPHRVLVPTSPYLRGFSDDFPVPVSRWTETRAADLPPGLDILVASDAAGPCLVEDPGHRALYMFNHIEYDTTSLDEEYRRDIARGAAIAVPAHYYPGDDPARAPRNGWRGHAHLFFANWINQLYQTTPFDLDDAER